MLLDPAILIDPVIALHVAEQARGDRSYASFDEGVERRFEESALQRAPRELVADGSRRIPRRRRRRPLALPLQPGRRGRVVRRDEPPRRRPSTTVRIPTLLVLGEDSYVTYDHLLDDHRAALGDLLEVVTVPGGHTVFWDALEETAAAISSFLALA